MISGNRIKNVNNWIIVFFVLISIFLFFYDEGFKRNNTISNTLLSLIVISLAITYFYSIFLEMRIKNLKKHFLFWMNSAFLIYYGTTFYLTLFEDFIRSYDNNLYYFIWPILLITNIIFNLILAKGIWTMRN